MSLMSFVSAVRAVNWRDLPSTYDTGEIVRDIVLSLASHDEEAGKWAWGQIYETVLQHQGTVYPATAAAAPFLCQIALDERSLWRAALTADLAFVSVGHDEPFAPAGTAMAVRDGVRPYVSQLMSLWGTADPGLDLALVALSVAFPVEANAVVPPLRDWFGRSQEPVRTALGLALGYHGLADDDAIRQVIADEVSGSRYTESSVPEAIHIAERWRAGAEEDVIDFAPLDGLLQTLMEESSWDLVDWPSR